MSAKTLHPGDVLEACESIILYRTKRMKMGDSFYTMPLTYGSFDILTIVDERDPVGVQALAVDLAWYKCLLSSTSEIVYLLASDRSVEAMIDGTDSAIRVVRMEQ